MDYGHTVCEMLAHASQQENPEQLAELVRCLSFGIAQSSSFVQSLEVQTQLLDHVFEVIRHEARDAFMQNNPVSPEDFLAYGFQPEKFNA